MVLPPQPVGHRPMATLVGAAQEIKADLSGLLSSWLVWGNVDAL